MTLFETVTVTETASVTVTMDSSLYHGQRMKNVRLLAMYVCEQHTSMYMNAYT